MKMSTDVKEQEPGVVKINFITSSPFSPIAFKLAMDIKNAVTGIKGVKKALVYCHEHTMEEAVNRP